MATQGVLHDLAQVSDPWIVGQRNFIETEKDLFFRTPTRINSTPVAVIGKPTSGTWLIQQVYRDSLLAEFRCTVAGTPGTWVQISPAVVTSDPGSPPTGYWIMRSDLNFAQYYWSGSAWVAIGGGASVGSTPPLDTGATSAGVSVFASREDHVHKLGELSDEYPDETLARLHLILLR